MTREKHEHDTETRIARSILQLFFPISIFLHGFFLYLFFNFSTFFFSFLFFSFILSRHHLFLSFFFSPPFFYIPSHFCIFSFHSLSFLIFLHSLFFSLTLVLIAFLLSPLQPTCLFLFLSSFFAKNDKCNIKMLCPYKCHFEHPH